MSTPDGTAELLPGMNLADRLELLGVMTPDEMSASLAFLAGYAPAMFDAALVRDRAMTERLQDRLDEDQDDEEDTGVPYCTTCGEVIGHFIGYDGWQHFRGNGTPENKTELYDPGHEPAVAWRYPEDGGQDGEARA